MCTQHDLMILNAYATGAQVYRKTSAGAWTNIAFPAGTNRYVSVISVYKGYLYVITGGATRSRIVRCKLCDGSDWTQVDGGFGVWKSSDGVKWVQVGSYGLGSSNNAYFYWGNSVVANTSNLFIGTQTQVSGGAVWKICASKACK